MKLEWHARTLHKVYHAEGEKAQYVIAHLDSGTRVYMFGLDTVLCPIRKDRAMVTVDVAVKDRIMAYDLGVEIAQQWEDVNMGAEITEVEEDA